MTTTGPVCVCVSTGSSTHTVPHTFTNKTRQVQTESEWSCGGAVDLWVERFWDRLRGRPPLHLS